MILISEICGCKFEIGGWVIATCEHGRDFTLGRRKKQYVLLDITQRPVVVCLCGSTRFSKAFQDANLDETLKGNIVLTIGCDTRSDNDLFAGDKDELKNALDILHLRKIDMADEVLILNVNGYIGESTARELAYAKLLNKDIRFLEPKR